jgi:hypothetical protein
MKCSVRAVRAQDLQNIGKQGWFLGYLNNESLENDLEMG